MISVQSRSTTPPASSPVHRSPFDRLCEKVSRALVPTLRKTAEQKKDVLHFLSQCRAALVEDHGAQEINLPTSLGTTINGLHFPGKLKKGIIFLHGNGYFCENAADKPLKWREGLKQPEGLPHLVMCNRGGTGKSEGTTHPITVAEEVVAQFDYLVQEHGIDPNDIVIVGYSMGGYLGAFGAEEIQRRYPESEINFISERSFKSIYGQGNAGEGRSFLIQKIIRLMLHLGIYFTKWARDPVAALGTLKGRVCVVYHKLDGVVLYDNSIHKAVIQTEKSKSYTYLSLEESDMHQAPNVEAHNRPLTEEEDEKIILEMKKMLRLPLSGKEELL